MGCKQSDLREDGKPINPEHLPKVPLQSWYALPFTEPSSMPFTPFHDSNKGHVLFAKRLIPTRRVELDALGDQLHTVRQFVLGTDPIYGMAYLHNSALHIEHSWRLRVTHDGSDNKFDRPFFDMLIGIKVFINDCLVPDSAPHDESLVQCTATYKAHEACTQWRAVPVALWPTEDNVMMQGTVYLGLLYSFLSAAVTLEAGEHDLRIEVVYGCKNEKNFCTDFISRGSITMIANETTRVQGERLIAVVEERINSVTGAVRPVPNPKDLCPFCGAARRFVCNTCHATICGSAKCVWSTFVGYPYGCLSHASQD